MNTTKKTTLPPDVLASDLKYPRWKEMAEDVGDRGVLTFYNVTTFGWCITTLKISTGRNGRADRTYAVRVEDGGQVRIGQGPHVTSTVIIYVRKSRAAKLKKYTDLYLKGAIRSNETRDRISTRRARRFSFY